MQQQQERERERREKERRELERRELERERERERMLQQQQRYAESSKHLAPTIRDRSPLCNGTDPQEIRVKEEPRTKEEEILGRTDARYHPYLRHPSSLQPPHSVLDRSRMLGHGLAHYPPPHGLYPPHADPFYRYDPLRYNSLVDVAIRAEEERVKLFGGYGAPPHPSQLRAKDPALMHLRPGPGPGPPATHKLCATPPTDLLKKDEPR